MAKTLIRNYICPWCNDDCQKTRVYTVTALNVTSNVGYSQSKSGHVQYFHISCFRAHAMGKVKEAE